MNVSIDLKSFLLLISFSEILSFKRSVSLITSDGNSVGRSKSYIIEFISVSFSPILPIHFIDEIDMKYFA